MAQKSSEPMRVDSDVMDVLRAIQNLTKSRCGVKPTFSLIIRTGTAEKDILVDSLVKLCRPPSNEEIRSAISGSKKRFKKARA